MTLGSGAWECMLVVQPWGGGLTVLAASAPKEHSGTNGGQLCWLGSASVTSALAPGGEWQGLLVSSVMKAVGVLLLSFGL